MRAPTARARRALLVALASVCLLPSFSPRPALAGNGVVSAAPYSDRIVPLADGAHPVFGAPPPLGAPGTATFVYLHGICGLTINGCPHFDGAPGWLACPQANQRCANGGSSWSGSVDDKIALVDHALEAVRTRWPESTNAPVVLVGFSQGAYVAMDLASAQPGRYAGLVLLGADTEGGLARLRASRVSRVALACGAYDMMFPKMRATAAELAPFGVAARFGSLGSVGHTYAAADGTDATLTGLLAWVRPGVDRAARSADAPSPPLPPAG
ncbi:MAG TPA: hypothetical protein VGI39_43490 [Polyangiaceae bacterium]